MSNQQIIFSTQTGSFCPKCSKPEKKCICRETKKNKIPKITGDIKVQREKKGRAGKMMTIVYNLPLNENELKKMTTSFKKKFATGGALKSGNIEIQGDHREAIYAHLIEQGYKAKKSGG